MAFSDTEVNGLAMALSIGGWAVLFGVLVTAAVSSSGGDEPRAHERGAPSVRDTAPAAATPGEFEPSSTELADFLDRAKGEADYEHGVIDRVALSAFRRLGDGSVVANGRVYPHVGDDIHWLRLFRFDATRRSGSGA